MMGSQGNGLGSGLRLSAGNLESRADNEGTKWGHVKVNELIKGPFRITWGYIEVDGLPGGHGGGF